MTAVLEQPSVLVTGVDGDYGQAIVKALRLAERGYVIHGCDAEANGAGRLFVDTMHRVPLASEATYVAELDRLCRGHGIDAVVPGSEHEMEVLSRLSSPPALPGGTPVICHGSSWFDRYADKLSCMQALSGIVPLAPFADGTDGEATARLVKEVGFPMVVKGRRSSGSRSVALAYDREQLESLLEHSAEPLIQAFIDDSQGEFSVGVFRSEDRPISIAFLRRLGLGGCSWYAEQSADQEVLDYSNRIAIAIDLRGSMNVQVRKGASGVRLLEINPRFSSLAAVRAAAGFCDVEWSLKLAWGERGTPEFAVREVRFQRFLAEAVDFGQGFRTLPAWEIRDSSHVATQPAAD